MSQIFSFQNHPVRTISENGQTWFAGSDIAKLLGYARPEKEVRRICKHVKLLKPTNLVGWGNSPRGFLIVPEGDVWRLIVHSTLSKAQEVEEWIMSEVLPAIRKTGKYEAKPKALPKAEQKALPAPKPSIPPFDYWNETLKVHTDICITASHVLNACDSMLDKARHALAHSKRLLDEAPR